MFKVGETIRCLDKRGAFALTEGKDYIVTDVKGKNLKVLNDESVYFWYASDRFGSNSKLATWIRNIFG